MQKHECVYAELGHPDKCALLRQAVVVVDHKAVALASFFERRGRRCPACHKKVTAQTSAGGRHKRFHALCREG